MEPLIELCLNLGRSLASGSVDATVLFAAGVGASVTLLLLLLYCLARAARDPIRRRVLQTSEGDRERPTRAGRIDRSLAPVRPFIVPKGGRELSAIRTRLAHAGLRGEAVVTVYYASRLSLILALAAVAGTIGFVRSGAMGAEAVIAMALGGSLGLLLPSYWLDRRIKARRREIVNGFPDVLDLIVACTEAGLGLNDAIQRVARETAPMYPALSTELELVNRQIRAGVDRVEALHGLARRTGLEEIGGFVSMVSQSVRFGTSIADTLRIFAEEFRDRRMQRAEEQAAKVGTKLIFPLVLCIFPSFFVVTIGPAAISITRALTRFH